MFIVMLKYKTSLNQVDDVVAAHRAFLDEGYEKNYFLASGPMNPRSGGVILTRALPRTTLDAVLQNDPFYREGIADYEVVEFDPVKCTAGMTAALAK
ncbi:Uncharacterized conserved protein YciI, contains a putative active-site phosphohistidine [Kosakonia oryzendophytica]|uniref:Uncharacterized conserved protein YciI, contains a putative active-site phosphohistidine n=1 Tax=Kosakonia oryzendophytica TaxID=1005665 RepID=A0A1C4AHS7_9ENTR|nr:YciI family protein [Kosakonia oryzendophytica]AMO50128.1 GTP cyclohydrolase II [Enterobacter sp. FY-07]TDT60563.1 uncharacterized protein YciI [Enterobacter sp. AG5470]WBT57121.1 YciI family protein [Kosakonia oryzendophytica]SCB94103.1 Uncharacterized conserved protein YciI, contains a putative active-site phosphohistidine [Kosakonia oryzendophytica]